MNSRIALSAMVGRQLSSTRLSSQVQRPTAPGEASYCGDQAWGWVQKHPGSTHPVLGSLQPSFLPL